MLALLPLHVRVRAVRERLVTAEHLSDDVVAVEAPLADREERVHDLAPGLLGQVKITKDLHVPYLRGDVDLAIAGLAGDLVEELDGLVIGAHWLFS